MSSPKNKNVKVNLTVPKVAWLTLLLFIGCVILWCCSLLLYLQGVIPIVLALILSTIAAFASFTPMHDSAHRSVSRLRWINELVGRINTILLFVPFPGLRYVHQEHHQHTNNKEKDPDYWSGLEPSWMRPFRWLTQDLHYYSFYLKTMHRCSRSERWESLLTAICLWIVVITFCFIGYAKVVLILWVLPARIAVATLAYSFDYLPHKPHKITVIEDPYKATIIRPSWLLTVLLLYQNYHLIHHLYPAVPFYRYAKVWCSQKDILLSKGAIVRDLLGRDISRQI